MNLEKQIKETVLAQIHALDVYNFDDYARENQKILRVLHEYEILDDASLESALDKFALNQARRNYELTLRSKTTTPNHVMEPQFLAYAIRKNVFSGDEMNNSRFREAKYLNDFLNLYKTDDFLANLQHRLLYPQPLK